jgi:hypothetical protein
MRYKFVNIFTMPFIDAALIIIQFEVWAHKTCLPPPMFIEVILTVLITLPKKKYLLLYNKRVIA